MLFYDNFRFVIKIFIIEVDISSSVNILVNSLRVMGWKKILEFQQDWNEVIIWQFYSTLEVHAQKEKLVWMIGTTIYKATLT